MARMTQPSGRVRFEVSVNGEVIATAGVDGFGVLTTILSWVRHDPQTIPEHIEPGEQAAWLKEETRVDVGGLDTEGHLDWGDRVLAVGDDIRIRVLPGGDVDEAERRPR